MKTGVRLLEEDQKPTTFIDWHASSGEVGFTMTQGVAPPVSVSPVGGAIVVRSKLMQIGVRYEFASHGHRMMATVLGDGSVLVYRRYEVLSLLRSALAAIIYRVRKMSGWD